MKKNWGLLQTWAKEELNKLPFETQEKYRITAKIMNHPVGFIQDAEEREDLKSDIEKAVKTLLVALEEHCDVVHICYLVDLNGNGATHPTHYSARLRPIVERHVRGSILEEIVAQKFYVVPAKKLTAQQKYTKTLDDLVSDSK